MKIAIVRLSSLGDIIHSSVILQSIKNHIDVSIDWFVDESFADILRSSLIDRVYALPLRSRKYQKCLSILRQARANNYDAIIDAQGLIKSSIVARCLGKNIYGYDAKSAREGLASVLYKHKLNIDYDKNIVVRNLALAAFFVEHYKSGVYKAGDEYLASSGFFNILCKKPYFDKLDKIDKISLDTPSTTNEILPTKDYILVFVGASKADKIYPKEHLINLANKLQEHTIYIVWGNELERQIAHHIQSHCANAHVLEKLSLSRLISYASNARLIIGNDSGPTHLGFALNVPSITLFGPTPSERNTYTTNINKVLKAPNLNIPTNEIYSCICSILRLKDCIDG